MRLRHINRVPARDCRAANWYSEAVQNASPGEITQLLNRWEQGEAGAIDQLAPLVFHQLRAIAEGYLRHERPGHTLQPTAVVNEIFLDLLRVQRVSLRDRSHFFAFAAQIARRILVDSARRAKSGKRGAGWQRIPLDAELAWVSAEDGAALDLSAALDSLARYDPVKTRAIEIHYFLGCTIEETADLLQISRATAERHLRFSLAWLQRQLRPA